ncbi:DUF2147 domain-containing protein [Spirosoma aerolatum]|uniref:DUF2147 domain-containing protein n=1 Tax=Spirosoma aerolatum TaxID=1211326 RepID=UPI0009AE2F27|nr:DUF2147 domain-containing protein [Spirosoma aerolatum]
MKQAIFIFSLLLGMTGSLFAQKATDNFAGTYKTDDDGALIAVSKTSNGFVGIDPAKRVVLKDIKFIDGLWKGTVYNPKKDITADCELYLVGNKLKIVAHKSILSKTVYWERQ